MSSLTDATTYYFAPKEIFCIDTENAHDAFMDGWIQGELMADIYTDEIVAGDKETYKMQSYYGNPASYAFHTETNDPRMIDAFVKGLGQAYIARLKSNGVAIKRAPRAIAA